MGYAEVEDQTPAPGLISSVSGHLFDQKKLLRKKRKKNSFFLQGKIQKESSLQKCEKIARNCPPEKKFRANFFCGSPSCDAGGCAS